MLSSASRIITLIAAVLYTILGVLLFLFSGSLAQGFAWKVSPFVKKEIHAEWASVQNGLKLLCDLRDDEIE